MLSVAPADCCIVFGIPLTEDGFQKHVRSPANRDFIQSQRLTWEKYRYFVADPCAEILPDLRSWGVSVTEDITLSGLESVFKRNPKVLILFTHWSEPDGRIEFSDGLVDCEQVVSVIPPTFKGLIDLCVCHPRKLVTQIKERYPTCLVKFTDTTADPLLWIYFYWTVFAILARNPADYFEVIASALTKITLSART